ncbi:COX15/CtaA family protein [Candidatus Legionella polyplacis]|uniref:COX15/CtaA family protein n=1 Tax=Candidatus Legionella polyplacis TaxID=2005262 RepID=UPI0013149E0F|nr:COX15/CtaA family protein [Candidatus Legionella polyplacis]
MVNNNFFDIKNFLIKIKIIRILVFFLLFLSVVVILLGSYTRLSNSGLGCPDWPFCYGSWFFLKSKLDYLSVLDIKKANIEIIHRYIASILGFFIIILDFLLFFFRSCFVRFPYKLFFSLLFLLLLQIELGKLTIILKLFPVIVVGHLTVGILIFSFLFYLILSLYPRVDINFYPKWNIWIKIGILIVFVQIILGGWVSSNYSGMSCVDFPKCNGIWIPKLYFSYIFKMFHLVNKNYQGGIFDIRIRSAIQEMHRLGAVFTLIYLLVLCISFMRYVEEKKLKIIIFAIVLIVIFQCILGVVNVIYFLPLWISIIHTFMAILLFSVLIFLLYLTQRRKYYCLLKV